MSAESIPSASSSRSAAGSDGLLKISELADRAEVPVATVRHYLREGLLPEPVKTSRNMAYYPPGFAARIRLIKQLQEERFMPLRVIRQLLDAAGDDLERVRALAAAGDAALERALAPERERVPEDEVLRRFDIPARALRRLAELGVLAPAESGYSRSEVRIIEAIARFRAAGWTERTGFTARDVARLMDGLRPVIADELGLLVERFTALDPERASELVAGGAAPFPDLIGALHAKLLTEALDAQRREGPASGSSRARAGTSVAMDGERDPRASDPPGREQPEHDPGEGEPEPEPGEDPGPLGNPASDEEAQSHGQQQG